MSPDTMTPSDLSKTPEIAAGAARFLSPVVIDLEALVVNGKQAHWHVRGGSFIGVHELLDGVVAHAQDYADTAAERVVALGCRSTRGWPPSPRKNTLSPLADGSRAGRPLLPRSWPSSTLPW